MDLITIKGINHYLYDNIEEFRAFGHKEDVIVDWRKGDEGDWIFTDDSFICQILKKGKMKSGNKKKTYIRTVCGSFINSRKNHRILGNDGISENMYRFSNNSFQKIKFVNKKKLFAQYYIESNNAIQSYKNAFPKASSKDYIKERVNNLLGDEMVTKEIQKILEEEGSSSRWIIKSFKEVVDNKKESASNKLRSLESLAKMAGLFNIEKKQEQLTVFQGFSSQQLEALQGGKEANVLAHIDKED
jgi:hypothetical protein